MLAPSLMTRVRMGERSGYTSGWCDAPHWGLVTAGRMAIEWEDDVKIVSTGATSSTARPDRLDTGWRPPIRRRSWT